MEETLGKYIREYKTQIQLGDIQKAYRGIMAYMMSLRNHLANKYPVDFITGSMYQGYMDITYFPFTPQSVKNQKLKIGITFNHEKMQFEIWLVGRNKKVQKEYWETLKKSNWNTYPLSKNAQNSIIEHIIDKNPDFDHLEILTKKLEQEVFIFIKNISNIFS